MNLARRRCRDVGQTSSMWAPGTFGPSGRDGRCSPPRTTFHRQSTAIFTSRTDRRLPVTLGTEAVPIRHQPLDRDPGQLHRYRDPRTGPVKA
jgi:hypothetical protein